MSRRDFDHDTVSRALQKDGWTITSDPLTLEYGGRNLYVDLAAEKPLLAEKNNQKIAVEIKGFQGISDVTEWERALGQFVFYRYLISLQEPERRLYLAMPQPVYDRFFSDARGVAFLQAQAIYIVTFDRDAEEIKQWLP